MAKHQSSFSPLKLLPLLVIAGVAGGAFYLYKYQPKQFNTVLETTKGKVKGVSTDFNIDASSLVDQAQKKLMEPQPIISDNGSQQDQEQANTIENTLKLETQKLINQALDQAKAQAQNLPKKEAARITRDLCNQIVSELEKEIQAP